MGVSKTSNILYYVEDSNGRGLCSVARCAITDRLAVVDIRTKHAISIQDTLLLNQLLLHIKDLNDDPNTRGL
jgi:hypothetical protein